MSSETFSEWLSVNRPELELVGDYINVSTKTVLQCKRCGAQIIATPRDIKRGRHICKCLAKRKAEEEYCRKLAKENPSVSLISNYSGPHSKALFRCNVCGNTWTQDASRINRIHCIACKKDEKRAEKRTALEETLKLTRPELKITGRYIDSGTHIQFYCKNCKSKQSLSPSQLLSGVECPGCKNDEKAKQLNDFLIANDSDLRIVGRYKGAATPIECICFNEHRFFVDPTTLKRDPSCPICKGIKASKKWKIVDHKQDFINWLKSNCTSLDPVSPYIDDDALMEFKCEKCNKRFSASPNQLKSGYTCPTCAKNDALKTKESFSEWLSKNRKDLVLAGDYAGPKYKTRFNCNYCGASWETSPLSVYQGSGCKSCAGSQTSYMQQVLLLAFQSRLGKVAVKSRDKNAVGRELDIYIPEKKFAIEIGAWHWHSKRVEKDLQKIELCKKAGIQLVVIYDQYRLGSPPYEGCLTYYSDLRYARSGEELRNLTYKLMEMAEIEYKPFSDAEWNSIHDVALTQCFKTDDKSFKEWLSEHYPSLRMVDKYKGANAAAEFQCRNCGAKMAIKPTYLQQEKYRKRCSNCDVLFTDGSVQEALFELWLTSAAPNITISGTYKSTRDLTMFHCNKCNTDFLRTPRSLKKCAAEGSVICPECRMESKGQEFISWLKSNTDGVCLNSKYTGVRDSVEFLCSKCGYRWTTSPHHMKEYKRCPKCDRRKTKTKKAAE